ncbi:MAG: hypothetical protein FD164_909 [Nitrospirae bacterium]|nr:MAG: hypothetical protein FD164_909 [Nitrospirota bacterium]
MIKTNIYIRNRKDTIMRFTFALVLLVLFLTPAAAFGQEIPLPAFEDGLRAEMAGDWNKAIAIYDGMLKRNPDQLPIWLRVADLYWALGNIEKTAEALTQAVRLKSGDAELYFRLSQSYSVMQKPEPALAAIEKAIELNPNKKEYWESRGSIANWLGKYDIAGQSLEKVLEIDPDAADAEINLARTQKWSGKLTKSVGTYRSYLEKNADRKDILLELAMAEAERGNYPAAEKILVGYADRFQHDDSSRAHLARVYAWDDRPDLSLSFLGPLLNAKPNDYELLYTRTVDLRHAERFPEALESVRQLEKLRPGSREVYDAGRFVRTPVRHYLTGGFNFYHDSDSVDIYRTYLKGAYFITPLTHAYAKAEFDIVRAQIGSGLENISGNASAFRTALALGINHRFSPLFAADVYAGEAFTESHTTPYYGLNAFIRPHDALKLQVAHAHDYYFPSARSLSLGIQRYLNQASFEWRPDLAWTVTGSAALNFFSRDNRQWEVQLFPRRAVLRTEVLNLDIGISALRTGFKEQDDTNGYYDPTLYQKYLLVGLWYWKIDDDNGVSFTTGAGINKDTTTDGFKGCFEGSVEGFFGIYRDWFVRMSLGGLHNLGQTGSYSGWSAGISITRRF